MAKSYRPVDRAQQFLLPPDMGQWLPASHLAWFVIAVVEELDMSAFEARSRLGGAGRARFDPRMLLSLLIYAYACGHRSSRQIERLCSSDVAFRVICAQDTPDHTTLARFRQAHEEAVTSLFAQVLGVCARAGLGRVGVVAIDGTKIKANASRSANRGEGWLREQAERIVAEAESVDTAEDELFPGARGDELDESWTDLASRAGRIRAAVRDLAAEDRKARAAGEQETAAGAEQAAAYAARMSDPDTDKAGCGAPPKGTDLVVLAQARMDREVARASERVAARQVREARAAAAGTTVCGARPVGVEDSARVRHARDRLAQAQAQAQAQAAAGAEAGEASPAGEHADQPHHRAGAAPGPAAQAQTKERYRNITDPDSRVMPSTEGWMQGYNAQLAVTDDQIILVTDLIQSPVDTPSFVPMLDAAQAAVTVLGKTTGQDRQIGVAVADAGYHSEVNLTAPGPDRLIATGKSRDHERTARATPTSGAPPPDSTARQAMEHRLATPEGLASYRRRGVTVEPVNGHLKDRIGLRRFARRGLSAAASELTFAAAVHNLLKVHRATPATG